MQDYKSIFKYAITMPSTDIFILNHQISMARMSTTVMAYKCAEKTFKEWRKDVIKQHLKDPFLTRLYKMKGLVI